METGGGKLTTYTLVLTAIASAGISLADHFGLLESFKDKFLNFVLLTNGIIMGVLAVVHEQASSSNRNISAIKSQLEQTTLDRVRTLKTTADPHLTSVAGDHISALIDKMVRVYEEKTIQLDDIELFRTIYKATLQKFKGNTFLATSIPDSEFFWRNRSIESSIAAFIRSGGTMSRIFFIESQDDLRSPEVQKILRIQQKLGVQVHTTSIHEIPLNLQRFVFADRHRKIGWEPIRGPDNRIKSIEITADEGTISSYLRLFDQLMTLDSTKEYQLTYIGLDPHNSGNIMSKSGIDVASFSLFEKQGWQLSANPYHKHFGPLTSKMAEVLLGVLAVDPRGKALLDIATGPGYLAKQAAKLGYTRVKGIDFSAVMIQLAKLEGGPAEFVEDDAESLSDPDGSYDVVTMNFGLLHLSQPAKAISEAYRVLKPGGKFAFTVWAEPERSIGFAIILAAIEAFADATIHIPQGPPFFYFSKAENCIAEMQSAGFRNIDVREIDLVWELESAEALFDAFLTGTARTGGLLRAQPREALNSIRDTATKDVARYEDNGRFKIPMCAIVAAGTK